LLLAVYERKPGMSKSRDILCTGRKGRGREQGREKEREREKKASRNDGMPFLKEEFGSEAKDNR